VVLPPTLSTPRPFPETHWSLIAHCKDPDAPSYRRSFEALCGRYWAPAYWFIRRNWGKEPEEAKDLCQAFFLRFYEKDFMRSVDAQKGRFRNFVCAALQRFLSKEWRDSNRQKRRPADGILLSIDVLKEDNESFDVSAGEMSPEEMDIFFREEWKKSVVQNALTQMREAVRGTEKQDHVEIFARYQVEYEKGNRPTRPKLAEEFGLSVDQVNYALKCQEREFVAALKNELRDQVTTEADFRAEARELFGI
jgi:RNA polymerase sigma-70 factor (ECF subfamily)